MEIGNEKLKVTVNSEGAELTSIIYSNHEYLWNADPKYWRRHAPILFPIVGKLKDGKTKIHDEEYQMSQHGFARDMTFYLSFQSENKVIYLLKSTKETLKKYPYKFELYVSYEVLNNKIIVDYKVKNMNNGDMLFSIGGHPAFCCPMEEGTCFDDYYIEFEEKETAKFIDPGTDGIVFTEKTGLDNEKIIKLNKEIFAKTDTLMYENLKSESVSLKSDKTEKEVILHFEGFPYLGIWTRSDDAPFICLEPWFGIADEKNTTGIFEEKRGIQRLPKDKTFECSYVIEIK